MRFRVLGCSGGSDPKHQPTSFLIDDTVAVDAGAITTTLAPEEQERIDHVVLSHAHLDHVATLPFLLDNRFARQTRPVVLYSGAETLADLRAGIFNNRVWPDFTSLRNRRSISLALVTVEAGVPFRVAHLRFTAVAMAHPVPCFGYLVAGETGAVFVAGDTGSPEGVRDAVAAVPDLKAIVLEVSFPDRMAEIARISGHVTPSLLRDAGPLHPTARLLVTHIKPSCRDEVVGELARCAIPNLEILEDGMVLDL